MVNVVSERGWLRCENFLIKLSILRLKQSAESGKFKFKLKWF